MPFSLLTTIPQTLSPLKPFPLCCRTVQLKSPRQLVRSHSHTPLRAIQSWVQGSIPQSLASALVAIIIATNVNSVSSLSEDAFSDIPQTLSGADKGPRIQKPKSRKAESCTIKCVVTCIRGGAGSPGEGPLNVRRPLVVFKDGFRTRQYCLTECSDICNLIEDGEDGP
ncbi:hypothetical protein SUGI_0475780 [Cryptomeria japonica]|nr:hypothetical protein SUGI_0475780 [Cryptomeria japonica]